MGGEALAVEQDFLTNFTFIKDLKSFWDAEHNVEGGELHLEEAQVTREERIALDNLKSDRFYCTAPQEGFLLLLFPLPLQNIQ